MKAFRSALCLLGLLVAAPTTAAPKNIILSDSLLANADKWDVKQGGQWLGIQKWRFGDYAVVASKNGWTATRTDTNFFKTKMESETAHQFSFVLSDKTNDSAFVSAARNIRSQSNPGLNLGHGWTAGGDGGQTHETDRFMASIMLNSDTTAAWGLSISQTDVTDRHGDSVEGGVTHTATLTSGERLIVLTPVYSRKIGKRPSFGTMIAMEFHPPAMGYEFVENGHSLCAVEYFSSGLSGSAKNTVWMDRNADPRMRLVLAAAMTAVLQLQSEIERAPAEGE